MDQLRGRAGDELSFKTALIPVGVMVTAAALLLDTGEAFAQPYLSFDVPVERWVQAASWGPLAYILELIDWTTGLMHTVLAVVIVIFVAVLVSRWRALVLALGSLANAWEGALKQVVHRPRPSSSLVHVQSHVSGFSYPSGHATFYTWIALLLAALFAGSAPRRARPFIWGLAVFVALASCVARVWAGAHWPSDVAGGFLLSLLWVALVLGWSRTKSGRWTRRRLEPRHTELAAAPEAGSR